MTNYFDAYGAVGVSFARTMLQASGKIGGSRSVFVDIEGVKNELVAPSWGGQWMNPFKTAAKIYAGDLFEIRTNEKGEEPKIYLLKTFEVAKESSDTTVYIVRDGFRHIPCVGDVLMKAPETIGGQGTAYTVQTVEATVDSGADVWKVTFNTTLGSLVKGDILVEAEAEGAGSQKMLVKNINGVAPCDYDFPFYPITNAANKFEEARVYIAPMLHGVMYVHKMSPVPPCVMAINKSRINGWYEL